MKEILVLTSFILVIVIVASVIVGATICLWNAALSKWADDGDKIAFGSGAVLMTLFDIAIVLYFISTIL